LRELLNDAASRTNDLGQPIGPPVADWRPLPWPRHEPMHGRYCRLEPLDAARHAADLHDAYSLDRDGRVWTYLFSGPFTTRDEYRAWVESRQGSRDPLFFAVVDTATDRATGVVSYLRIDPAHGVVEVGHIAFSPLLQRTRAATEAMYLMMQHAFGLGYRRYEWKCDALNAPSRRAAERLGFTFEGVFRQAVVYKGRSRDTAWYSVIDSEWPARETAFRAWLDPGNFETDGRQRRPLRGT
jgi:RimJ/RimL family protein N-acetyltransferase